MKLFTFLLLLIAINSKGQDSLTFSSGSSGSITWGPSYKSIIGSNLMFLSGTKVKDSKLWYISANNSFDMIAWMNADSSIEIKDTMATIIELLKHISLREHEVTKLYDLQEQLYKKINNIYRKNYVVDKKKFDKVVADNKKALEH